MEVIIWTPSYDGWGQTCHLTTLLTLAVRRQPTGKNDPAPVWTASVFGRKLTGTFKSEESAKSHAVDVARRHLTEAIDNLITHVQGVK